MRCFAIVTVAVLALTASACSKPTQQKASADLKAAGAAIGESAKAVAADPAVKAVGADIKQGAAEAAGKTVVAVDKAGDQLSESARKAGAQIKQGAKTAGEKTDTALNKANEDAKR